MTSGQAPILPPLPCPECREGGHQRRIGNRRRTCKTCNNFARNVTRIAQKRLAEAHAEEFLRIRLSVEADLYPQVIDEHALAMGIIPGVASIRMEDLR